MEVDCSRYPRFCGALPLYRYTNGLPRKAQSGQAGTQSLGLVGREWHVAGLPKRGRLRAGRASVDSSEFVSKGSNRC